MWRIAVGGERENAPPRPAFSCSGAFAASGFVPDGHSAQSQHKKRSSALPVHATLILWPCSSGSCHHSRSGSTNLGLVSPRKLSHSAEVAVCKWTALFHSDYKDVEMWQILSRRNSPSSQKHLKCRRDVTSEWIFSQHGRIDTCMFKENDFMEDKELRMGCSLTSAKLFENYRFGYLAVWDLDPVGAQNSKWHSNPNQS